jgi:hypothetical protein
MLSRMQAGFGLMAVSILVLGGCKPKDEFTANGAAHRSGRYAGIGIYQPEASWTRMVAAQEAADTPAARPVDDQAVIVVVDSDTGEVRSCGDLTGYCVGMNPWAKPLAPSQTAPISLSRHEQPPDDARDAAASDAAATMSAARHRANNSR